MSTSAVTELMAARRYLTSVLFHLSIESEHLTAHQLIHLLDYYAEHPSEYLNDSNECRKTT
jgi:hypothetical protein